MKRHPTTPSATEQAGIELAKDLLVHIAAEHAMEQLDPTSPQEAGFLDWYAREARAPLPVAERQRLDAGADEFV